MKKSKGLLFRIKCINSTLPTKDICFLRNPTLYKNQRCIACLRNNESLYHIAECEIYIKIWKNLEEEALQLTGLQTITKLDFALEDKPLRIAIFGNELNSHIQNRKMLLRGLTSIKQQREVMKLTSSKRKANKVLTIFLEQFWTCFFERLWKFRCEIMIEQEKRNNISAREKKTKRKRKRANLDKENCRPPDAEKKTKKEKKIDIQGEACKKIDKQIAYGSMEEWS